MFCISFQKIFSFLRKSNFRILDIQISWRHQMSKHKTRNTFYWITWEVSIVCYWNLASLCHISKENNSSENSMKITAWKLVPGLFVFAKNSAKPLLETEIANLSKFIQISLQTSLDSFLQRFLWKLKRAGTSFS